MYLFTAGDAAVRKMENTAEDKARLLEWLTTPAVIRWVYGEGTPWNLAKVEEAFGPKLDGGENATACLIEYAGEAIGYIQFYPLDQDAYCFQDAIPYERVAGGYGIDLFIGKPALWGKGIGTQIAGEMAAYLFRYHHARVVCADPEETNRRSLRCWEKAGFIPLGRIPCGDNPAVRCILMAKYG